MSEATSILADLLAWGASIWADNGELVVEAKRGVVTPEIKAALTRSKAELLLTLGQERGVSWAEWKAAMLDRLFLEQGTSGAGADQGRDSRERREEKYRSEIGIR